LRLPRRATARVCPYFLRRYDIGATLFALGRAMEQPLASAEVAQLAVGIEPSDSSLFPGLTLFDSATIRLVVTKVIWLFSKSE
jgi:hypothetical protein